MEVPANRHFVCLYRQRLSRAGTRGHYLVFPRSASRRAEFGLHTRIRLRLTPLYSQHAQRRQDRARACLYDGLLVRASCLVPAQTIDNVAEPTRERPSSRPYNAALTHAEREDDVIRNVRLVGHRLQPLLHIAADLCCEATPEPCCDGVLVLEADLPSSRMA